MTIRLPVGLAEGAQRVKTDRESFNDLVVEALEHEVRRRRGLRTYATIQQTRRRIETRTGTQPDSVALIRAMREEGQRG